MDGWGDLDRRMGGFIKKLLLLLFDSLYDWKGGVDGIFLFLFGRRMWGFFGGCLAYLVGLCRFL